MRFLEKSIVIPHAANEHKMHKFAVVTGTLDTVFPDLGMVIDRKNDIQHKKNNMRLLVIVSDKSVSAKTRGRESNPAYIVTDVIANAATTINVMTGENEAESIPVPVPKTRMLMTLNASGVIRSEKFSRLMCFIRTLDRHLKTAHMSCRANELKKFLRRFFVAVDVPVSVMLKMILHGISTRFKYRTQIHNGQSFRFQ